MHEIKRIYRFILRRPIFFAVLIVALASFIPYLPSLFGYFQADEWHFFKQFFVTLNQPYGLLKLLFGHLLTPLLYNGHFTPLLPIISYLQITFFGLDFIKYQLLSILLHVAVSISLFYYAYLLSKKNILLALIAAIFFAISATHFQAIIWIASVGVQISLLFAILSLICLELSFEVTTKKYIVWSLIFFLLSLFSKETSIFLIFIYPIRVMFEEKKLRATIKSLKGFGIVTALYFIIRFLYQLFVSEVAKFNGSTQGYETFIPPSDIGELLYKIVTLVSKGFVQVFIPSNILYTIGEKVTVLGFPQYAQEASVRGINYLTFAQSAAIELFIYPFAIFLGILFFLIFRFFIKTYMQRVMVIGVLFIIGSILPFLFIVSSLSNFFGYFVTLDSRHIYTLSVGGGLLFASAVIYLYESSKKVPFLRARRQYVVSILIILVGLWCLANILSILDIEHSYNDTADQRKRIISTILHDVKPSNKMAVLILSDSGYYGFGLMPPFQTNLGEILTVLFYNRNWLPVEFLDSAYFTRNNLTTEGYLEIENKGFGYFLTEKALTESVLDNHIPLENIYAFGWNGTKKEITNISSIERKKMTQLTKKAQPYIKWKKYSIPTESFIITLPPDAVISEAQTAPDIAKNIDIFLNNGDNVNILIRKKTYNIGIFEDLALYSDSEGKKIGVDSYIRNVTMLNGEVIPTLIPTTGTSIKYFVPTVLPERIIEITHVGYPGGGKAHSKTVEEIISLFKVIGK